MSWLSERADVIRGHLPDWESRIPQAPGGPGALQRAAEQNDWTGGPFQSGGSSWDTGLLMGSGPRLRDTASGERMSLNDIRDWNYRQPGRSHTDDPFDRGLGRTLGSIFAIAGAGAALGGTGATGAEAGAESYPGYDSGFPGDPGSAYPVTGSASVDAGGAGEFSGYPTPDETGQLPGIYGPEAAVNTPWYQNLWSSMTMPSLRTTAYGLNIAAGVGGLAQSWEMRKQRKEQERRPRAYQQQGDALMANPGSV